MRLVGLTTAALLAVSTAPAAANTNDPGFLDRLARGINQLRLAHGLGPLQPAHAMLQLANEHSQDMAEARQLSHQGFNQRLQRAARGLCVENVASNFRTPESLLNGWRRSPGHERNLLDPEITQMGIAARGVYVTFFACH
jgi:uncharacterized protein YkwD